MDDLAKQGDSKKGRDVVGGLSVVFVFFPSMWTGFWLVRPYWLETSAMRAVMCLVAVGIITFFGTLVLLFPFVLLCRPFVGKKAIKQSMFSFQTPALRFYDRALLSWVNVLWK